MLCNYDADLKKKNILYDILVKKLTLVCFDKYKIPV